LKPRHVNDSSQSNQGTDNWFLNLSIDNTKEKSLNTKSKTPEAQLEDQKPKKSLKMPSRRRKTATPTKRKK
jgi:hypothetical protein